MSAWGQASKATHRRGRTDGMDVGMGVGGSEGSREWACRGSRQNGGLSCGCVGHDTHEPERWSIGQSARPAGSCALSIAHAVYVLCMSRDAIDSIEEGCGARF